MLSEVILGSVYFTSLPAAIKLFPILSQIHNYLARFCHSHSHSHIYKHVICACSLCMCIYNVCFQYVCVCV